MPGAQGAILDLFTNDGLSATANSPPQFSFAWDHLWLHYDLTLAGVSSLKVALQYAQFDSGASDGRAWEDVYDANGGQVEMTLTASATRWRLLSTDNNNTRMLPAPLLPVWRIQIIPTGSPTSDDFSLKAQPFSLGVAQS